MTWELDLAEKMLTPPRQVKRDRDILQARHDEMIEIENRERQQQLAADKDYQEWLEEIKWEDRCR